MPRTVQRTIHRVVITGIGAVTPIGNTVAEFWEGLRTGRNGITRLTLHDPDPLPVKIAGEVKQFDPELYMDRKTARRTGRFAQFALAAATQALDDSGLGRPEPGTLRDDIGVIMATSGGAFDMGESWMEMQTKGANRADPMIVARLGGHMGAARVGRELGLRGPNSTINTACASGTDALGHALDMIRLGQVRAILAGGAESIIAPLALASMGRMGALSHNNDDPEHASRPFDRTRDGFVLGEGAGVVMLESEESALARGARIYCELAGVGWAFDAVDDSSPDAAGQALAIRRAIEDAGLQPEDVEYINAHGTSTPLNDKTETQAIKLALGAHAYRIPISSNKSMTGHLAAAAGGMEAVATVLTMLHGCLPPTINYVTPDPECDLDVVPNVARSATPRVVLSNSFGLGGQNAAAVFVRYEP